MTLGSASFQFLVDNQQAIAAGAQTEAALKKNYAAVAQAAGVSAAQVERSAQQIAQAQNAQAAGFSNLAKSAGATAVAIAGVTVGLAALKEGLDASVAATLKAEQAQRTLTAAYRDSAPQFKAFADAQAQAFGRTNSEVEEGVARLSVLQKQYGITSIEIEKLTRVALNLGATFGDNAEAIRSVQAAIRGEPEALEKYQIALQENAIKTSNLLTKAERENFTSLDAVSQARIRYRIILAEAAKYEGAAEERAKSAQGSFDRLTRATDEAAKAIGARLVPALAAGADGLASYIEQSGKVAQRNSDLAASFEDFARRYTSALGPLSAIGLFDLITGRGQAPAAPAQPPAGARDTGTMYGPSVGDVKAITDQLIAEERRRQEQIAELRKEKRDAEAKAGERAAEAEHDREAKALDDRKILLEVERDQKLRAVEETTKGALAGIEAEARAAEAASEATLDRLRVEQEEAQRTASDRHDDAIAGLEAEQRATEAVTEGAIRQLEIARDTARQVSEDRRDQAIADLDAEKQARDAARVDEDRAAEDSARNATRREADRHEAAVRGFDAETRAANESKDQQLRNLDELGKKAEDKHQDRLRHLSDEADAERDRHDEAARALDDEADREQKRHDIAARIIEDRGKAASDEHERAQRRLSDEADAARDAHDRLIREGEDEQRAAGVVHEERLAEIENEGEAASDERERVTRAIEDEGEAAAAVHERTLRAIDAEGRAAEDTHEQAMRRIADEGDAAERVHEQALRGLEERGRAEDDRRRRVLDGLDEEQRRRQDAIDAQIGQLDALDRAGEQAAQATRLTGQVEGARRGVQKAESTGNLSEIEAAQRELAQAEQAILDAQTKNQRDATREQLRTRKDAIRDEIDARQGAENERSRILKQELADEKQAADDRLKLTRDGLDARKRAADDELALVQRGLDQRKRAADDEYALIRTGLDARKRAADDAFALIRDELQERKRAADAAYKLVTDDVAARKLAADDALKAILDRVAKEKNAEDEAYKAGQDRRAKEKTDLDDAYKAGQDRRAAAKRDLDDELRRALDRIGREKTEEDDAFNKTKDRLAKRKLAVADANKDELDKIAARKLAENDAHDNAVAKAQDQATQEKRAVQDRRTAEDLADKARREEIRLAFENEARDRKARYDDEATGEIPALRRALAAAQETFRRRKEAADLAYQSEQREIQDLYTNAQTGLIPLAQKAAREVADRFRDQAAAVTASAQAQKAAINDQYTNPGKTGLLDLLERARADSQDKLDKQKQYWRDWAEDIGGPQGQIKKVIGRFDDLINKIKEAGGQVNVDGRPGQPGGPYGPPAPPGYGGPGPGVGGVPDPYQVSFPFGARYSNPFNPAIPVHRGVDLTVKGAPNGGKGYPVTAFEDGRVVYDGFDPNGGNGIIIRGSDGLFHRYFHFDSTGVEMGQQIHRGDVLGRLGESGTEGSPHLHYEVSKNQNGDPVGDLIDPVPFMRAGAAAGGQTFEFDLFGRHFVVTLPFGTAPAGDVGKWIATALQEAGLPADWLVPLEQIAAAESGVRNPDGSVRIGTGDAHAVNPEAVNGEHASGLMQTLPSTFARNRLPSLPDDVFNPVANAAAAARYIKGIYGDPRNTLYFTEGRFDWRGVPGYANGGMIPEPTLLVGRDRGPYAVAGETGRPEWVTPHAPGANGGAGPLQQQDVHISLGGVTLAKLVVKGMQLELSRSGTLPGLGG